MGGTGWSWEGHSGTERKMVAWEVQGGHGSGRAVMVGSWWTWESNGGTGWTWEGRDRTGWSRGGG